MFDRVIAIDWSGRKNDRGQRNAIWACETAIDRNGRWCILGLRSGRTRDETADWLVGQAAGGGRLLVGIDFAFSLPQGYVAYQMEITKETWADVVEYCRERGKSILRDCPPPFWGRGGATKPQSPQFSQFGLRSLSRKTEARTGATSVFQLIGGAQVGPAALRGIPYLGMLCEQGFHIWPFDGPPDATGAAPVVVEIYPRVFSPAIPKSNRGAREMFLADLRVLGETWDWLSIDDEALGLATRSVDAFDALVSAAMMCRELSVPGFGFERYGLDFYNDPPVHVEGWIWGVAHHTD